MNFLTLRPAPLLVRHGGSQPPVTRPAPPVSRRPCIKRILKYRKFSKTPFCWPMRELSLYSKHFCRTFVSRFVGWLKLAFPAIPVFHEKKKWFFKRVTLFCLSFSQPMSFSRFATRGLRSISRRAPKSLTQQSASYSLLTARTAAVAAKLPQRAATQASILSSPLHICTHNERDVYRLFAE